MSGAQITALQADVAALNSTVLAQQSLMSSQYQALQALISSANAEVDTFYVLWAACLVFLMQCGFATLAAGSIREKNVRNILLKNGLDACVGLVVWYLVGYGLSLDGTRFIGNNRNNFALSRLDDENVNANGYDWISFFFSYTFAAAAATIVSGAVAERCKLSAYIVYTCFITGFIYPVVVHWVWDGGGFLSAANPDHILGGVIDFAGSGVVHMTGGVASFVAAKILGPRIGRWESPEEFEGHSTPLQILGTFLLWFGWYGFNCGSTLTLHGNSGTMARVAVTTTISAAVSGCMGVLIKRFVPKFLGGSGIYDVGHTCNSILGGLVGVTAGCATFSANGAFICGAVSAFVYHSGSCLMRKLKIDDPLDAFAVHGACGFWGCIAVGILTLTPYSYAPNTASDAYGGVNGTHDGGIFTGETNGWLFGSQFVGCLIEIAWVGTCSTILFGSLKLCGILRVDPKDEVRGLDDSKHGGSAYRTSNVGNGTSPPKSSSSASASAVAV
jgi:Amt family ammonium transporter